ncbi:MAG TPA: plastocyanin/azurin family copper-binding protein [Gemmatimonadaceae bacterium]|nr:plastocyanin/azurin family copper-binding protein [Gemmatimonadaceae bacterium]
MRTVFVALAVVGLAACGGGGGGSTSPPGITPGNTPPPSNGISVNNNGYSPANKTIAVGATVQWAWNTCSGDPYGGQQSCVSHSVTFDDGQTSPTQDQGSYSRTFSAAGTYNYHCAIHGAAMAGTVTVQ